MIALLLALLSLVLSGGAVLLAVRGMRRERRRQRDLDAAIGRTIGEVQSAIRALEPEHGWSHRLRDRGPQQ